MEPNGRRLRRTGVRRGWVGSLGLALLVASAPAAAAQQRDATRLEVDAGYGGTYLSGRRLPVHVTVSTDHLIRGTLEVTIAELPGSWGIDVEVAAGGDGSEFIVVVPTPAMFDLREVQVRLTGAGEAVTAEADVDALADEELVGLLPGVAPADLPEPLALPLEVGTARFVALELEELGIAGVLDPFGTVVAGPEEVGGLSPGARSNVLDWVDRGGRLVVDAAAGTPIAGVPDEWQPGARSRTPAGLGEVRLVGGAAAAGRWTEVVEPTPTASLPDLSRIGGFFFPGNESVGSAVARDAGLENLDLPWLLVFLGAYVALVGPVAWLVLRRRRALGWVVVPALAGLFTAGSFVVGSDLRDGTTAAHGTVLDIGPGGARATTVLGLVSRNGRDARSDFPEGWTAGGVDTSWFGDGFGTNELAIRSSSAGVDAAVPLGAGGFGLLRGAGPVEVEGGLVVEARSVGDEVVGTIENRLPYAVEEVGAILGRGTDQVGRIEPGATAQFRFRGTEFRQSDAYSPPESSLWPAESGVAGPVRSDSTVNLALWTDAQIALGANSRARGVVTVVGWTRGVDAPATVRGEPSPSGRSAVVARAPVTSGDGSVAPGSVRREIVRGPAGVDLPDDGVGTRVAGIVWRFTLPDGADVGGLALDVPAYAGRVEAWDGTAWVPLHDDLEGVEDLFNNGGDVTALTTVDLPPELGATGVLWVRGWLLADFGGGFDGAGLDLHGVVA